MSDPGAWRPHCGRHGRHQAGEREESPMEIKEKVVTHYSVHFTQEDVTLIQSVLQDVCPRVDNKTIFSDRAGGFAQTLSMLAAIQDSAHYNRNLTYRDKDTIQDLTEYLCTFEVRYPDDPRFQAVDDLWKSLQDVKDKMYSEISFYERSI